MFREISTIDAENTAALKAAMPATGWFAPTSDAPDLPSHAWLIAQHSPDRDLQREVLARIKPLLRTGLVRARDYALLYDRLQLFAGLPQRFASQAACRGGTWQLERLEDRTEVDRLRTAIGWSETLSETQERLRVGAPC
jgi:hypothetical protein